MFQSYDTASRHCFVGDSNGNITFLKLTDSGCEFKATLNGHEGSIQSLAWDSNRKFLFSLFGLSSTSFVCCESSF